MIKKINLELLSKIIMVLSLFSSLILSAIYGIDERLGTIFNYSLFALALLYLVILLISGTFKTDFKDKIVIAIYVFLIGFFMTVLINNKIIDNAKFFIFAIIQSYIIYRYSRINREFCIKLLKLFILCVFTFNLISLVMYLLDIELSFYVDRFCGLYSGPNIGSAVVAFSAILSVVIVTIEKKKWELWFVAINIILSMFLLSSFNSRSGVVVYFAFVFLFPIVYQCLKSRKVIKSIFIGILTFIVTIALFYGTKESFKIIKDYTSNIYVISQKNHNKQQASDKRDNENIEASNKFRFALIQYGIQTGFEHPLLGIGDRNIADAIEANSPFHIIGIQGGGVHNVYVGVFVSNGFVGLASFLFILISIVLINLKKLKLFLKTGETDENTLINAGLFVVFLCFLGYGFLESNLIISASVITTLFWITAGLVSEDGKQIN